MDFASSMSSTENHDGKSSMGPHAVMVTVPMLGHIHPLLQFAKALVAHHNFTVTFVNNHYYHHYLLSKEPPPSTSSGRSRHGKLRFEWVENGLPLDFNFTNILLKPVELTQSCIDMQAPLKALLQSLNQKGPPVSCVIFGSFFFWAHHTAAELGIPSVFFWSQSAAVFSIYYHMHLLENNGFFPYKKRSHPVTEFEEEGANWVSYIPGVTPLHPSDFPTFLHEEDTSNFHLKNLEWQFNVLKQCKAVVINSFHELEREPCEALRAEPISVFVVGPLLLSMQARNSPSDVTHNTTTVENSQGELEGDECLQWLDKQSKHSVLYISFGTVTNPPTEDMAGIASGLKESKQPFIWVIRPTCHRSASGAVTSFRSVAETLPENFLEDTKDFGLIVSWAPQQQVLGHTSTGAFLTHCGWNSTLESVSMGVPMIALAVMSDQTTNCKYLVDIWKVGMRLQREENGKVDRVDVNRVLRVVFQEEEGRELRRRADKLRGTAWRALETRSGSSSVDMHNFSQAMRCPTSKHPNQPLLI